MKHKKFNFIVILLHIIYISKVNAQVGRMVIRKDSVVNIQEKLELVQAKQNAIAMEKAAKEAAVKKAAAKKRKILKKKKVPKKPMFVSDQYIVKTIIKPIIAKISPPVLN